MAELSNEVLMAYVDGELDAAERARVEAELGRSPDLRARVETFWATREPLQSTFDHVLREPVPQHLVDLVRNLGRTGAESASNVVSLDTQRQRTSDGGGHSFAEGGWPFRVAAGIALTLLVGGGGWLLRGVGDSSEQAGQTVAFATSLQRALEVAPSRRSVEITDEGKPAGDLRIISTFVNAQNAYCREYDVNLASAARFGGFACRTPAGDWTIEHHVRRTADKSAPSKSLAPARGPSGQLDRASNDPHTAAIEAVMIGGSLDEHEEQLLIKSGWTAKLPKR